MVVFNTERGHAWSAWARKIGRPRAVLVVSAHWETGGVVLGTVERRELIYDFYGFPEELFQVRYPANGSPESRERVAGLLARAGIATTVQPERGWDHGVWTPLVHMFPDADVPLLQLSLPRSLDGQGLLDLGRALAPLRAEGILILGSGSMTHNLGMVRFNHRGPDAPEWVMAFDTWVAEHLATGDFAALARADLEAPYFRENHPTPEHYRPLLVAAGAAGQDAKVRFPVEGFEFGVLSTRCVEFY